MKNLKNLNDFQNENQSAISELQMIEVIGGRSEDCVCKEDYGTTGGDNDHWEYLDTSNGKKFLSHSVSYSLAP